VKEGALVGDEVGSVEGVLMGIPDGDGDGIHVGSLPRRPLVGETEGVLVGLSSEETVGLEVGNNVGDAVGERDGAFVLTGTFSSHSLFSQTAQLGSPSKASIAVVTHSFQ